MRRGAFVVILSGILLHTRVADAQSSGPPLPKVTPGWTANVFRGGDDLIELTLDRALGARERLAMLVSNTDVSALVDVDGTRVRYRPNSQLWHGAESEVVVFLVRDTSWTELAKLPIKVRNRLGLDEGRVQPTADLSSAGQLKAGGTAATSSARQTYQDVTLRLGASSSMRRAPWQFTFGGNAIGVTNEQQRLRFAQKSSDAPPVDLSDYTMRLSRGANAVYAGNVSRNDHKFLLANFRSRGVGSALRLGGIGTVDAAVMNGTSVVGFANLLGLERAAHRIASAKVNLELLPKRPGAVHVALTGVDGSVLPRQNFNQASVTDAEQSTGFGSHVDLATPDDRLAFTGGVARSRFRNPSDPLLAGDSTLVAVRPESRWARYGEVRAQVLRERRVTDSMTMDLQLIARHERVDPMYRAVGLSTQADMATNGADVTARVGSLSVAAQLSQARDNLAKIASLLTSHTNSLALTSALPLTSVIGSADDWYLPVLGYTRQGTHQYGEGVPTNGEFTEADIPDQNSVSQIISLDWAHESSTFGYRWNGSSQDNRQPGYESADINGVTQSFTLGLAPLQRMTLTLEYTMERQRFGDSDLRQGLNRIGTMAKWQPDQKTTLSGNVSHSSTVPNADESKRNNMEMQFEASRMFALYKVAGGAPPLRLFARFARSLQSQQAQFAGAISSRTLRWTLTAGGSARLF